MKYTYKYKESSESDNELEVKEDIQDKYISIQL